MNSTPLTTSPQALLVLPHLRVQNANAISSFMTHGFPSITAFTGLMWALQRQLAAAGIPLKLQQVGVICHHHEEQVTDGYVKTFRLTRNPVKKNGNAASIVEEGRIHLEITLVFQVEVMQQALSAASPALAGDPDPQLAEWAAQIGEIVAHMRIAGGTLLPQRPLPGQRTRPWMALLPEAYEDQAQAFTRWRRQWLPGYALVGRDDLLAERHRTLRDEQPDATLLDAWLHAARFNHQCMTDTETDTGETADSAASGGAARRSGGKLRWADPARQKGAGWTVPIPVGYAALTQPLPSSAVANTRDTSTPCVFVESVYSFGQWLSPHRLNDLHELLWWPETDAATGLYRCRSGYMHHSPGEPWAADDLPEFD
ncbi:type I-F CRISPR-associated protein Csy2 [Paraburkholderia hayleyella]|uniref:type I-F CRISPR-associated protein Csy2 n=1 Tax=Paraburkholderia hayleyella TaxID=2152889 RepID=UPI0012915C6D|nr:type I-F CRISPR-associated protein Csy2 [Paraburkholderia hayleyella]